MDAKLAWLPKRKSAWKKSLNKNYRPKSQEFLNDKDGTFDFRHSAYRRSHTYISLLYEETLVSLHRKMLESLVLDYKMVIKDYEESKSGGSSLNILKGKGKGEGGGGDSQPVPVTFVSTGLSDPDRQMFVNCTLKALGADTKILCAESHCESCA